MEELIEANAPPLAKLDGSAADVPAVVVEQGEGCYMFFADRVKVATDGADRE